MSSKNPGNEFIRKDKTMSLFLKYGATSVSTAKHLKDLHLSTGPALNHLLKTKAIVKTKSGKYYLDQRAAKQVAVSDPKNKFVYVLAVGFLIIVLLLSLI